MTYGPPPPQGPPPGYGPRPPQGPPPQGPPPGYGPPPPQGPPPGYGPPPPQGPPPGYGPPQGPPPGYGPPPPPQGPPPGYGPPPPQGPPPGYGPPPPQGPPPGYGPPPPGAPPQAPQPPSAPAGGHQSPAADSQPSSAAQEEIIAPRSGKVGEMLEGSGRFGLRASWRVVSIEYPADDVFVDAGLSIPDGYASAIIGALFTNKGTEPVSAVPAEGMYLIDTNDNRHLAAPATVEARPGFRDGQVMPEESIAGHLFYLIAKDRGVRGAQWQDGDEKLTWLR